MIRFWFQLSRCLRNCSVPFRSVLRFFGGLRSVLFRPQNITHNNNIIFVIRPTLPDIFYSFWTHWKIIIIVHYDSSSVYIAIITPNRKITQRYATPPYRDAKHLRLIGYSSLFDSVIIHIVSKYSTITRFTFPRFSTQKSQKERGNAETALRKNSLSFCHDFESKFKISVLVLFTSPDSMLFNVISVANFYLVLTIFAQ